MWRSITEADLLTRLSASELDAIRNLAEGEDRGDPITDAVANVTAKVRGYIAGNRANVMGAGGTLPGTLIDVAVALLVVDLYSRSAGLLIDLNDTRRKSAEAAERTLRDVAAGSFRVELPDGAADAFAGSSAAEMASPSAPLRRNDLAGL